MSIVLSVCLFVGLFFGQLYAQNSDSTTIENKLQELKAQLKQSKKETQVKLLNQISEIYKNSQPNEARNYAMRALNLARKLEDAKGEAEALKNIGIVYQMQGNDSQALQYFLQALKIFEEEKNEQGIAESLNDIGIIYQNQGKYAEAQKYYDRVLEIDEKIKDRAGQANTLNNIGDLHYQQDDFEKALEFYNKSLQIRQELQEQEGIAVSLKNIGLVYYTQTNYQKALEFYLQSLTIDTKLDNKANISATSNNVANTYLKLEKLDSALIYALNSLDIAEQIHLRKDITDASFTLADIYATYRDFEKAYQYQLLHIITKNELFNEENSKKIADLQTSYELEKKQTENALLNKSRELFLTLLIGALSVVILVVILVIILYRNNLQKQKTNNLLLQLNAELNQQKEEVSAQRDAIEEQRNEIEKQSKIIAEKSQNIESSIRYAQRIQQAMLPYEARINETLPLHFILYRPRDVVSGDFYWFAKVEPRPVFGSGQEFGTRNSRLIGFSNEKVVLAAVDCTGHGVPGAFMSMIGDALLNQIVIDRGITKADMILNEMQKGIRKALKQSESHNRDGMDMALCVFDFTSKTIEYAGAKNSLIYIQDKQVHEIPANNFSVGGYREDGDVERIYTAHTISFEKSSITLYLYSDGFQDQFGGPEDKKFMRRNFKSLLFNIHHEPMSFQGKILEQTILDWMGNTNEQMDDILVIGVRVE